MNDPIVVTAETTEPSHPYSETLVNLVRQHWVGMGNHLLGSDPEKGMLDMLNEERSSEGLDLVASHVPFPLPGRRLLEIGSGVGTTVLVARKRGIEAHGVEPGSGVAVGKLLLEENGFDSSAIQDGVGEKLPFPEGSFDVVCSFQVLEHTQRPSKVLAETIRVLKPGGYFVHVFPSYGSFWEGHYGVPWIPHMPKALGRIYIRLLGRDLSMVEELQLLTHGSVTRMLKRHRNVRVLDYGMDLWEHRVRTLQFSEWGQLGRLKKMVRILHKLHLVGAMVALGKLLHFETPIVLVGVKTRSR